MPHKLINLHRLPPSYRQSLFPGKHPARSLQNVRNFHSTQSNQLLEPTLYGISNTLTGLHAITGLPWVATLPLAAFFVRSVIVGALVYRGHIARQRQLNLQPLLNAWKHTYRRRVIRELGPSGPVESDRAVMNRLRVKRTEMYNNWGCQLWKTLLPIAQFPIWLLLIETIRRMCGTHEGLLGLATGLFRGTNVDTGREATLKALTVSSVPVEESFATEGALWFQNLLVPDPTLTLPFVLSGMMFANVHFSSRSSSLPGGERSTFERRMTRILKLVALAVGPLMLQVPSAMLLYWISSSALAMGQRVILDKLMPYTPPVKPCKPKQSMIGAEIMKR